MLHKPHLFPALISSGFCGEQDVFLTQRAQSFTQGAQRGYGGKWCSTTTEAENALWGGAAHREADGREYHPVSRLAGMRVCWHVWEQAYSKIAYGQDCVRKEILRLPCQAALQDGRAGGISMSLGFLVLFFQEKSTEENFTLTARGFTGHEHYPYFNIINMNGRLYDPVIARFFSPDKYVANSSFTQDFNRYTYARNNPLMYTDPSGEFLWWIPIAAIGISAAIAATSYTIQVAASPGGFQNWSWDQFGFNIMMGIGQGLITSAVGGAFGAVGTFGVIGEIGRAGAHALVGGMFSYAMDGNFWSGAAASGFSSLMGSATAGLPWYAQIATSTLTGGVASKMTGGTFWQGAVNGAMVSILNHAMHEIGNALDDPKRNLSLKYDGDKLHVIDNNTGEVVYTTTATSGKGEHMNNPASQNIKDKGPIPEGKYRYSNKNWNSLTKWQQLKRIMTGTDWGTHNVPLEIIINNQPNRGNFYLHGGITPGTSGCIDAGKNIKQIYNLTKSQPTTYLIVEY